MKKFVPFILVIMIVQACTDYNGFGRDGSTCATMTFVNPTCHTVKVSIGNIVLAQGESESVFVGGDTIYRLWSVWGDTVYFLYDDSIEVKHYWTMGSEAVDYTPASNNVLNLRSWELVGEHGAYEYKIDSI
ncbi:MAG: hypothetical protein II975_08340 [Bacteroidales bacterium]|nr:hypothetical protein [Bacteroidales bacterium]